MEDNVITMSETNHYDIDSLCDSDREELEHALYSQIHYGTDGADTVDYTDYIYNPSCILTSTPHVSQKTGEHALSAVTLNNENCKDEKHLEVAQEIILNHTAKDCKNFPKSSNGKRNESSHLKPKTLKQNLKGSTVSSNNKNIIKTVKSRKEMMDEDEKKESKYRFSLKNRTKPSHTVTTVNIDSDLENSDNSSVLTISDSDMSDSDSSSMCCKIFTKDSKPSDIQLNIGNDNNDDGNNDIDDILLVTDHSSSDGNDKEDEKWHVSEQDILRSRPEIFRYYKYDAVKNVRCKNCREKGHLSRDCPKPKVIVCYLCGNRDHLSTACPEPICYNCSQPGHVSSECTQSQYKWYVKCSRCDMPGHQHEYCPDNWRRYHVTTVGEPKDFKVKINPRKFCCNCGSYKHFGYKCNKPPMSSHAQITYPFIVSYKPPIVKKHKLPTKKYFNDDEVLEPVFKKKKIQLIGIDEKPKKETTRKIKAMKNIKMKSPDPLKNFKKIMKDYKNVKDKNNKKKQKGQKLRNIQEKSAFVKSAKKSNLDNKLFLYTDKHLNRKNKVNSKKKFEKQDKKKKGRKGKKVI